MRRFTDLVSTSLIVPEALSALARERRPLDEADALLASISIDAPADAMRDACEEALSAGPLRGADLWHVASALTIAGPRHRDALTFLTLDGPQRRVAAGLGFAT
jgi:hypothetical protein